MFGVVKNKIMYGKKVRASAQHLPGLARRPAGWPGNGAVFKVLAVWTKSSRPSNPQGPEEGRLSPARIAQGSIALAIPSGSLSIHATHQPFCLGKTHGVGNGSMPLVTVPLAPTQKAALASRRFLLSDPSVTPFTDRGPVTMPCPPTPAPARAALLAPEAFGHGPPSRSDHPANEPVVAPQVTVAKCRPAPAVRQTARVLRWQCPMPHRWSRSRPASAHHLNLSPHSVVCSTGTRKARSPSAVADCYPSTAPAAATTTRARKPAARVRPSFSVLDTNVLLHDPNQPVPV